MWVKSCQLLSALQLLINTNYHINTTVSNWFVHTCDISSGLLPTNMPDIRHHNRLFDRAIRVAEQIRGRTDENLLQRIGWFKTDVEPMMNLAYQQQITAGDDADGSASAVSM